MKISARLAPVLFVFVVGAASAQTPATPMSPLVTPSPIATPPDTTPKLALGQMMKSGDKLVFSPCRDRSYATVQDISNDSQVTKALNKIGLAAGKKLYVELVGVLENSILKVSDINLARTEGRCQLPGGKDEVWRAAGNEPGWSLVAGETGVEVTLKRMGKADVSVPYSAFKTEGTMTRFEASKENQKLALRFERKQCFDTMADAVFGWTATVEHNGQVLKGCAWQR
ncbi:MAG: hypothetical protein PHV02_21105 [Rhodocyclaceae bacterium]|nr:hypothetical protein [Rhodocyclaceae bacterium]